MIGFSYSVGSARLKMKEKIISSREIKKSLKERLEDFNL
jgi:hypothetical protein